MRGVKTGFLVLALSMSFMTAAPAPADPTINDLIASTTAANCQGVYCVVAQGKGTGVIVNGRLETAFACSARVRAKTGPTPTTAPVATQVTHCYMTTAYPSQTPSVVRTLPGAASAVHGQFPLNNFSSPVRICVAGKVFFEDNSELRVPASGVECTPPNEIVVLTTASNCQGSYCAVIEGTGTGVIVGGRLETAFSCSAHVGAQAGPTPTTAPVAAQVTQCYMTTAFPSQTPTVARTLPGAASVAHGQFSLDDFSSPVRICVAGKVFFEDNSELRVPASGVACISP